MTEDFKKRVTTRDEETVMSLMMTLISECSNSETSDFMQLLFLCLLDYSVSLLKDIMRENLVSERFSRATEELEKIMSNLKKNPD